MLTCHKLTRTYRLQTAINEVSLQVENNKMVGLIGGSGAGKTTLLKLLAGYLRPTAGHVSLDGNEVFDNLNALSLVRYAGDDEMLPLSMKISDIMMHYASFYSDWNEDLVTEWISICGLRKTTRYKELSKGMQRQLQIRAALGSKVPFLMLDEPLSGLDYYSSKKMCALLLDEYVNKPRTMIISTHNMNEMEHILEEIIFMHDGKLLLHKPLSELQEYALRLTGSQHILVPFSLKKQVYDHESFGSSCTLIIRNDLTAKERWELEQLGIHIGKVSVQDLYVYITHFKEEGSK